MTDLALTLSITDEAMFHFSPERPLDVFDFGSRFLDHSSAHVSFGIVGVVADLALLVRLDDLHVVFDLIRQKLRLTLLAFVRVQQCLLFI